MKARIKVLCIFLLLFVCAGRGNQPAKYVFLFIGDGMGENHCIAADYYLKNTTGSGLCFKEFPVKGKVTTFSKSSDVTDSAAAGTALSSGHKVSNGALNYDKDSGRTFEPLAVYAKKHGFKAAVISSVPINHATPAAFYAAVKGRGDYYDIALQMAASDIDYLAGAYHLQIPEGKDNIKELAAANKFTVVGSKESFDALDGAAGKTWVYSDMPAAIDNGRAISLAQLTAKAIEMLKDGDGFFIMVEGGQIDWASHANDGAAMIYEMTDFDEAIRQAVNFYNANPAQTLILVTADHETGGLSLDNDKITSPQICEIVKAQKGSRSVSGDMFKKIEKDKLSFEQALPLMQEYFAISHLTEAEKEEIRKAFYDGGEAKGDFSYGDNKKISLAWVRLVSARAAMNWGGLGHTSAPVPLYAIGSRAESFGGNLDNTLIAVYLREIIAETAAAKEKK